jgi:putative hydrolase of the HAD superfamily
MTIAAVVFDRDNTLLHFDRAAVADLERRVAALAPGLPPGAASAHWLSWPGPWPRTAEEEPVFWRSFWERFALHHALPQHSSTELMAIGDFYHSCFRAFPDAAPTLGALRSRDLRLAVLTNFELPSIDRTLRYAGLEPDWFDALISSGATGVAKPDPRAYALATAALGLAPQACLFVDDLPENVAGARAAGLRAVLLDRTAPSAPPERIAALPELLSLIG